MSLLDAGIIGFVWGMLFGVLFLIGLEWFASRPVRKARRGLRR